MKALGEYKWCPKCRDFRDLSEFGRDSKRPDGRHVYCKRCRHGYYRAQKPEPETVFYTNSEYPSRGSVPNDKRKEFDELTEAGVEVTLVTPDGKEIAWGELD